MISSNESLPEQATTEKQMVTKENQVLKVVKAAQGKLQNNKNNKKGVNTIKILNKKNANVPNKVQNNKTEPNHPTDKPQGQKRKIAKEGDNNKRKRRKLTGDQLTFVINGVEEKLVHFQGIPIRKSDADRLKLLRKTMLNQGKPKSEVEQTVKAERRKAEKRISRVRKYVCFHCRKSGHLISDCPEMSKGTNPNEPPICFICKEQGHKSRECPDNTKGLYPNGGACKLCGEVTHFKKDCPTTTQETLSKEVDTT